MTTATKARPRDTPTKRATIVEAMDGVFAAWFAGGASWDGWRAVLKAMDGLPMSETEVDFQIDRGGLRTTEPAGV
jgi:hypothetical protein